MLCFTFLICTPAKNSQTRTPKYKTAIKSLLTGCTLLQPDFFLGVSLSETMSMISPLELVNTCFCISIHKNTPYLCVL